MADTNMYVTVHKVDEVQVKCAVRDCPHIGLSRNRLDVEAVHDLGWFRVYVCDECQSKLTHLLTHHPRSLFFGTNDKLYEHLTNNVTMFLPNAQDVKDALKLGNVSLESLLLIHEFLCNYHIMVHKGKDDEQVPVQEEIAHEQ